MAFFVTCIALGKAFSFSPDKNTTPCKTMPRTELSSSELLVNFVSIFNQSQFLFPNNYFIRVKNIFNMHLKHKHEHAAKLLRELKKMTVIKRWAHIPNVSPFLLFNLSCLFIQIYVDLSTIFELTCILKILWTLNHSRK